MAQESSPAVMEEARPAPAAAPTLFAPFGSTPTSINQILASKLITGSLRPSQFVAPVVSGPQPGSPVGVAGSALLSLGIAIDYSMGSFSLPIQFPPNSILLWAADMVYAPFAGGTQDTSFELGTGSGRNDILAANGFGAAIHTMSIVPVTGTLPFATDPNPFQAWLTVTPYGNTSGSALLLLLYARGVAAWS